MPHLPRFTSLLKTSLFILSTIVLVSVLTCSCYNRTKSYATTEKYTKKISSPKVAKIPPIPLIKVEAPNKAILMVQVVNVDWYSPGDHVVVSLKGKTPTLCENCVSTGNDPDYIFGTVRGKFKK